MTDMLEKLRKTLRLRGLRATLALFVKEYVFHYSREFVVVRRLANEGQLNPSFRYQRIEPDRRAALRDIDSPYRYEELCDYLDRGDFIFVAYHGNMPIGYHIVSTRPRMRLPYSRLPLHKDRAWVVDIHSHADYREQHVASSLRTFRESYLLGLGFTETIGTIKESNTASLRYAYGAPSKEVMFFTFIRLLTFTKFKLIPDAADRMERLLIGRGVVKPHETTVGVKSGNELEIHSETGG